jgi:hypothetical protein
MLRLITPLRAWPDELALPPGQQLIEETVGRAAQELLVVLEPLGRDQPHQQGPVIGVQRRVEGDELVVGREVPPVLLKQVGQVVARQLERQVENGPAGPVDRGVDLRLVVDLQRLFVAGVLTTGSSFVPLYRTNVRLCGIPRVVSCEPGVKACQCPYPR